MCRPRSSLRIPIVVGALAALSLVGCGKGLYTQVGHFYEADGSTESGDGGGAGGASGGGGGSGSTLPNAGSPPDTGLPQTSDVAPKLDVEPGTEKTEAVSGETTTTILLGGATLIFQKGTFPSDPRPVTLSLVNNDGAAPIPGYSGAIGPVYSITTDFNLWDGASFRIRFTPDSAIPPSRIGMAYIDLSSKIWVLITKPAPGLYDSNTGEVIGTVVGFSGKRYFAPVETCGPDAGACHSSLSCKAEACQE